MAWRGVLLLVLLGVSTRSAFGAGEYCSVLANNASNTCTTGSCATINPPLDNFYASNSVCVIPGANGVLDNIVCPNTGAVQKIDLKNAAGAVYGDLTVFRTYNDQLFLSPRFYSSGGLPTVLVQTDTGAATSSMIFLSDSLANSTSNYDDALNRAGNYTCATLAIDLKSMCTSGTSKYVPNVLGSNSNCRCTADNTFNPSLCAPTDVSSAANLFLRATYMVATMDDENCTSDIHPNWFKETPVFCDGKPICFVKSTKKRIKC
jgi:hypothetical protein